MRRRALTISMTALSAVPVRTSAQVIFLWCNIIRQGERAELRAIDLEAKRTAEAKARFEARQARLEREKTGA